MVLTSWRRPPEPARAEGSAACLPRVLIVSDAPFSDYHGIGVTLTNLFAGWPTDQLGLLCSVWSPTHQMKAQIDRCYFQHQFRFPGPGGRLDWLKSELGLIGTWMSQPSKSWHNRRFRLWRPDLVYSIFLDLNTFAYADWLSKFMDVPHVCHIVDDIAGGLSEDGVDRLRNSLSQVARRVAISDEMKRQYEGLVGCEFHVFHNGVPSLLAAPPAVERSSDLILRYLGNVSAIQHGALRELAEAVRRARARGLSCRLEIVGSFWEEHLDSSFVDGQAVRRVGPYVSREDWTALLHSADLLVVPVASSHHEAMRVGLSLPTKLFEYFSTRSPVLVYGPGDSAPSQFCCRHQVASVISGPDVEAVVRFLTRLSLDAHEFRAKAVRDQETIWRSFSNEAIGAKFRRLLVDAAMSA